MYVDNTKPSVTFPTESSKGTFDNSVTSLSEYGWSLKGWRASSVGNSTNATSSIADSSILNSGN